jgi:hypothetical protein
MTARTDTGLLRQVQYTPFCQDRHLTARTDTGLLGQVQYTPFCQDRYMTARTDLLRQVQYTHLSGQVHDFKD